MASRAKEIIDKLLQEGESGVQRFIDDREVETLFLDFKRSADNGSGKKIHKSDRENLAKAISGFGNSEGGVIIWGVDCRPGENYADVAQALFPIDDPMRFKSWLEGCVTASTTPPHSKVEHHTILSSGNKGYVATHIPKSNEAPHQVITNGKGQHHYYIRAGSDFVPTPHAVLSGMFGRRPQPKIFEMYTLADPVIYENNWPHKFMVKTSLGIQLFNDGPGVAQDLFMWVRAASPGQNCVMSIEPRNKTWNSWTAFNIEFTTISDIGFRMPPGIRIQPFIIELDLIPPFDKALEIQGRCGCSQSPFKDFSIKHDPDSLMQVYEAYIKDYENGCTDDELSQYNFWDISKPVID